MVAGLQLPFGVRPVNPVPVDAWSGPYSGISDTVTSAVDAANSAIPLAARFVSMEVRLLVGGKARKFWYRDGVTDADLVEFSTTPVIKAGSGITVSSDKSGAVTVSTTGGGSGSQLVSTVAWKFMEKAVGSSDEFNVDFDLSESPYPVNSLMLFVNGVLQVAEDDYSLVGSHVTLAEPVHYGSKVVATYSYQTVGANIAWMERPVGVVDGVNVDFSLANSPSPSASLMFFVNGVLQTQGDDYTLNGNVVSLLEVPLVSTNLTATYSY